MIMSRPDNVPTRPGVRDVLQAGVRRHPFHH